MIPKKIHYCWFGRGTKNELMERCIRTWRLHLPEYEIIEWNETNFDVNSHPYTKKAYDQKKWAFVSDYVRFVALQTQGGIYMDTDMYVLKSFNSLLDTHCFVGKEDEVTLSCGIIGATPENPFIKGILLRYNTLTTFETVPRVMTQVYESAHYALKIYEPDYFYPFNQQEIKYFTGSNAPTISYAVHLWNYSWGHPLLRFLNQYKLYKNIIKTLDQIGIKKGIKRILKLS